MICYTSYTDCSRTDSQVTVEDVSVRLLTLSALVETLSGIAGATIQATDFIDGKGLMSVHISGPTVVVPAGPFKSDIIQPFNPPNNISAQAKLWITGNDNATGIGALDIVSCIIVESSGYKVYSVFEDYLLDKATCKKVMHDLCQNTLLLEQHMKISKNGEVFVH